MKLTDGWEQTKRKLTDKELAALRKEYWIQQFKEFMKVTMFFLILTIAALSMGGCKGGPELKVKRITCPSLGIDLHFDENGKEIAK
jgi:hypothetical protein